MIARGFRPVAWVAAIGAAALSCYMLSLQVASERAELSSIERRIVATRQDIRQLQTELGTRGRLQQLEAWNADVLALSAPISGQFVESNVSLARFDTRAPSIDERAADVQLASAETPAAASAVTVAPRRAALVARPVALEPPRPIVQRASLTTAPALVRSVARTPLVRSTIRQAAAPTRTAGPSSAPVRTAINLLPEALTGRPAAPEPRRPAAAPQRRSGLLADDTLRDLGRTARAERGGARN